MKMCSLCLRALPLDDFYRRANGNLRPECKECVRARSKRNYEANGTKRRPGSLQAWRERNRERLRQQDRVKYRRNAAARRASQRRWYEKNRERVHEKNRIRAQKRRSAPFSAESKEWLGMVWWDPICPYCKQPPQTRSIEHIVPINSNGTSAVDNVVMACRQCNSSKSDESLLRFMLRAG